MAVWLTVVRWRCEIKPYVERYFPRSVFFGYTQSHTQVRKQGDNFFRTYVNKYILITLIQISKNFIRRQFGSSDDENLRGNWLDDNAITSPAINRKLAVEADESISLGTSIVFIENAFFHQAYIECSTLRYCFIAYRCTPSAETITYRNHVPTLYDY